MLKYQKLGFTLAETIMTLFIVGLVVTAAIPVFTIRRNNAPIASDTPWHTCEGSHGGLCTNFKVAIPSNAQGIDANYAFTLQSAATSPYDVFHSDRRSLMIGDYYFNEGNNNLIISKNDVKFTKRNNVANFILDSGNFTTNFDDFDAATSNNVLVGHGNELNNGCNSNVVLGNSNTIGSSSPSNNSIIFGNGNEISHVNSSIIIGTDCKLDGGDTSFGDRGGTTIIGCPTEIKSNTVIESGMPGGASTPFQPADVSLYIGDYIFGTLGQDHQLGVIRFNDDITLSSSMTVNVPLTSSDERLKNIKGSYSKGLKEILQVQPVVFAYKSDNAANENVGVIAQDIQKVFPEAVISMPSGFLGVDTDPMFFAMINSLKEINADTQAEINRQQALKDELAQLKSELAELNACRANGFIGKIECFISDVKRFFKSIAWFTKGEADAKA